MMMYWRIAVVWIWIVLWMIVDVLWKTTRGHVAQSVSCLVPTWRQLDVSIAEESDDRRLTSGLPRRPTRMKKKKQQQ